MMKVELLPGVHLISAGRFNFGHPINCNVYLVRGTSKTVLIDAGCGFGIDELVGALAAHGLEPSAIDSILLTHTHWDHARGAGRLLARGVHEVAVHPAGVEALTVGPRWYEFGFEPAPEVTFEPVQKAQTLRDGEQIDLGGRTLRVLYTPGHTSDSVCFLIEENGNRYAFTGDTVSVYGRPGVMTADTDFRSYRDSLAQLRELRLEGLFPGHGQWLQRYADEHVAVLADRLAGKWSDLAPHPKPMDSGIWVLRNHPELISD
jgi:hydroxyacylglutathione hydrolase